MQRRDAGCHEERCAAQASRNAAYENVLENKYDRARRMDADRLGVTLAEPGRLRADGLGDVSHAARRTQQGPEGAERPVRVAPGHAGAAGQSRPSGARAQDDGVGDGGRALSRVDVFKPVAIDGSRPRPSPRSRRRAGAASSASELAQRDGQREVERPDGVLGRIARGQSGPRRQGRAQQDPVPVTVTAAEIAEFKKGIAG